MIIVLQQLRRSCVCLLTMKLCKSSLNDHKCCCLSNCGVLVLGLHFGDEGISDAIYDEVRFDMWLTTHAHFFSLFLQWM